MDLLGDEAILSALKRVLREGVVFDLQYYDRAFLAKECASAVNKELVPMGYSVVVSDNVNFDIYYIKINQKILTIHMAETGLKLPKGTKKELLAGVSPVMTCLIQKLTELTEN
tara:strand:- start:92 stop:430 length:339 start_codon:yes stop_codon:yes gene_type:complete